MNNKVEILNKINEQIAVLQSQMDKLPRLNSGRVSYVNGGFDSGMDDVSIKQERSGLQKRIMELEMYKEEVRNMNTNFTIPLGSIMHFNFDGEMEDYVVVLEPTSDLGQISVRSPIYKGLASKINVNEDGSINLPEGGISINGGILTSVEVPKKGHTK